MFRFVKTHFVTKTIVVVVASVAATSLISLWYFVRMNRTRLLESFGNEVAITQQLIENSYREPLWNVQVDLIRTLNEAILSAPSYVAVAVYDSDGPGGRRPTVATFKKTAGARVEYRHVEGQLAPDGRNLGVVGGILVHQGRTIGEYELYYTREHVMGHMRRLLLNLAASILLISLVTSGLLVVLLNQFVIKKLFSIIGFARAVASEGRYDRRIDLESADEIGELAHSINDMLGQIERRDREKDAVSRELAANRTYLQSVFDAIADAMLVHEPERGLIVDVNRSMCEMFRCTRDEVLGKDVGWISLNAPPYDAAASVRWMEKSKSCGPQTFLWHTRRRNGELFWSEVSVNHSLIGGESRFIVLVRDITERMRAEEELRRMRHYLGNVIDSMPSVLVRVDAEGRVTQWNVQAQRTTGLPAAEAVGKPLAEVFPRLAPEMERAHLAMHSRLAQTSSRRTRHVGNETVFEDVAIYPLVADGVEGAVIRVDDVTEHVRIEEMVLQSEKMLSVGGLAAGMAHEINNPLGGMIQTATVLADRLSNESLPANLAAAELAGTNVAAVRAYMEARNVFRLLENIRSSGARAAEIVANMLSFARKDDSTFGEHDMAELLDRCVDLAGSDYDLKKQYDFRSVEIVREYEANLPRVPCKAGKIQQVLLNVLRNGAEAMQENGSERHPRLALRLACEAAAKKVRIEIEDNGPGMDETTRRRVFEPFFTTKATDRGTGLGLSVSYFIVTENHGGEMRVESVRDKGTKFVIWLPLERSES